MIPLLRLLLISLWVACVGGTVVIAGLVLGNYSWTTFLVGGVAGVVLGVPAAMANWIWLRPNAARRAGLTR